MKKETAYEEILKWLETHDDSLPRADISVQGRMLLRKEMTKEESKEVNLYHRWLSSDERKALEACRRNTNR